VFPHLSAAEARRAAVEMRCSALKSRALGVVLAGARGEPVYPPVVADAVLGGLRGPAILTTAHIGALGAIGALLRRLPGDVLALHRMEWRMPSNVTGLHVPDTDPANAAAFHRALTTLRRHGCVFLLADGGGHDVPFLGGVVKIKRGPFALARMTGAPVVAVLARWDGAVVRITSGPPIAAGDDEAEMARAMARVIERHLLEHPSEIGAHWLDPLSRALARGGSAAST
jgi:lauroyl/myristoyl acyltransferase